jgi:hypothetical protein
VFRVNDREISQNDLDEENPQYRDAPPTVVPIPLHVMMGLIVNMVHCIDVATT